MYHRRNLKKTPCLIQLFMIGNNNKTGRKTSTNSLPNCTKFGSRYTKLSLSAQWIVLRDLLFCHP